jgi:hypothetical protein
MAARLWTALLMMAAVFAMHGLQCSTAAADAPHTSTPMAEPAAADQPMSSASAGSASDPGAAHLSTVPATVDHTGAVPTTAAPPAAGHDPTPHSTAGHLWSLCLGVLAAGIAVLLTLVGTRLVQLTPHALSHPRARSTGRLSPARPPDLSVLCILRT